MQRRLFPPVRPGVPSVEGLGYHPDFVSQADEQALLAAVDAAPWSTEWQRRRRVYGVGYGGSTGTGEDRLDPMPSWLDDLGRRVVAAGFFEHLPENARGRRVSVTLRLAR